MSKQDNIGLEPWERQPNESARAFEAFAVYRDMGAGRSIRRVGQNLVKSGTLISDWSVKHNWVGRCSAWDAEQDRIARAEQAEAIQKMKKTHADIASAMLAKVTGALMALPEDEMTANDISRMVEVAAKLERLSRGEATDKIENKIENQTNITGSVKFSTIDLSELTSEELVQLEKLISKLPSE